MSELVTREDRDGVATLTLNRPEALNALSPALFEQLRAHIDTIAGQTETVGCVVLRGEGRSFSAGNDLKAIQAGEAAPSPHFQAETIDAIEGLPQPVIASVHGHCYTGALELALGCDFIVCAESARFASSTHGRWSLTPTWGMSQRLPRRVGVAQAKQMMYSGTPVTGEQAAAIGLANVCVPDEELEATVSGLTASIVANSWHTVRSDKMLVNEGQRRVYHEALAFERENSPGRGPDMEERLKAFSGKK
ncbi:MAG: enoyl-CoA hydratase/isomerase family protein [Dehalococcoidia bacterium]|nr:enoyl-CoA hydratase/isomerase family protein [Dehalococcoidia bacterium]